MGWPDPTSSRGRLVQGDRGQDLEPPGGHRRPRAGSNGEEMDAFRLPLARKSTNASQEHHEGQNRSAVAGVVAVTLHGCRLVPAVSPSRVLLSEGGSSAQWRVVWWLFQPRGVVDRRGEYS